jgi:rubrerythrin
MVKPPWWRTKITVRTTKQEFEVADVIRQFEAAYRQRYPVTPQQGRVLAALKACRTAELGGHIYECNKCGALEFAYRSCRDRHCPKCGKFKKAEWIERQKVVLLPIPYFHITFTTDHALNPLVAANQKVIYDALFWAVSETLKRFGKKYLGGTLGITAVLHTWGQQMDRHVHLHCIVTGGALSEDGQQFRRSGADYLFDVVKLSAEYRDRFCRKLKRLAKAGKLKLVGAAAEIDVEQVVEQMQAKKWEVFAKPFADPQLVYEYLSRYVHQVAISNYRIVKIERGQIYFEYHDNKDGGKKKVLKLAGVEFVRRFLWHVLPERFVHIRHYGLHQSNARKQKLPQARELLGLERAVPAAKELDLKEWLTEILGEEVVDRCPHCGAGGTMFKRSEFEQLNWLQLLLFALLGLSVYGTVKPRGARR